ncbi:MAG: hypothetical protein RLY85_478 [Bacteroidota bacterium]
MAVQSPEFKLLLSCCRLLPTSDELVERDIALAKGIDSSIFLALVERHRVAPIVYLNLKDDFRIESSVRVALFEQFNRNRVFALRMKMWQSRLERLLLHEHVPFVFLKGIPLAELYYGDLAARHTLDIDVLVDRGALLRVVQLLLQLGFHPAPDIRIFKSRQLDYFIATNHDLAFHRIDEGFNITIELHWRYRGAMKGFDLATVRQLDKVEEFLYLCTHGTEHAWFRLKWLFDLVQILQKNKMDWVAVCMRAKELDCLMHLEIAWLALNRILGLPIPSPIEKELNGKVYDSQLSHIAFCLESLETVNENDWMRWQHLLYLKGFPKRRSGFYLVMRYLTGPEDWKLLPLPNGLFFLYFLLRPFLFLWRKLTFRKIVGIALTVYTTVSL